MDEFRYETPTQSVLEEGYLDPNDAITSAPMLFPSNETEAFIPDPKNFADLLPQLDLDGNSRLNRAELKAAAFNDSLSQMQLRMIDLLALRFDQVRMLGPTDLLQDNLEISVADLDETNKVASNGYDLKNFASTTLQNMGEIPHGLLFGAVAEIATGVLLKSPFLVKMGTGGFTMAAGAGGIKSLFDSAENKALQSELQTLFVEDSLPV